MKHDAKSFAGGTSGRYASPACSMHEVDPTYMGCWSNAEIAAFLITFLENERAISRASTLLAGMEDDLFVKQALRQSVKTEKYFCREILREILIRRGKPTLETGALFAEVMRSPDIDGRLEILRAGYENSLDEINGALRAIVDQNLHSKLNSLLEARSQTIQALTVVCGAKVKLDIPH